MSADTDVAHSAFQALELPALVRQLGPARFRQLYHTPQSSQRLFHQLAALLNPPRGTRPETAQAEASQAILALQAWRQATGEDPAVDVPGQGGQATFSGEVQASRLPVGPRAHQVARTLGVELIDPALARQPSRGAPRPDPAGALLRAAQAQDLHLRASRGLPLPTAEAEPPLDAPAAAEGFKGVGATAGADKNSAPPLDQEPPWDDAAQNQALARTAAGRNAPWSPNAAGVPSATGQFAERLTLENRTPAALSGDVQNLVGQELAGQPHLAGDALTARLGQRLAQRAEGLRLDPAAETPDLALSAVTLDALESRGVQWGALPPRGPLGLGVALAGARRRVQRELTAWETELGQSPADPADADQAARQKAPGLQLLQNLSAQRGFQDPRRGKDLPQALIDHLTAAYHEGARRAGQTKERTQEMTERLGKLAAGLTGRIAQGALTMTGVGAPVTAALKTASILRSLATRVAKALSESGKEASRGVEKGALANNPIADFLKATASDLAGMGAELQAATQNLGKGLQGLQLAANAAQSVQRHEQQEQQRQGPNPTTARAVDLP